MDSNRNFLNRFSKHFERIDKELNKNFSSRVPMIEDIGRHSLLGKGKRLRPLLFLLSGKLCGYKGEDIYSLSTMFEYIHNASLLHDDVIDNAATRRSKPSAKHIWGNSAAVLTGDYLSSKAAAIAVRTNNIELLKMAIDTGARMSEGQFLELIHTGDWNTSKDEYMDIITSKTAELMSTTCACGAIIAGAGKEISYNLSKYGLNLGIAFQLVDDLLDYASSEEELGKPVGKDLREGKITLPLIYTLSGSKNEEINRFENQFKGQDADEEDYMKLIKFVRKSGAIERIRSEAKEYSGKASEFLDIFPESPVKTDLIDLNEYVSKRNF
ncbi:polyprenyl synthetase family protein [Thermodesulfobacteriota bacterium]